MILSEVEKTIARLILSGHFTKVPFGLREADIAVGWCIGLRSTRNASYVDGKLVHQVSGLIDSVGDPGDSSQPRAFLRKPVFHSMSFLGEWAAWANVPRFTQGECLEDVFGHLSLFARLSVDVDTDETYTRYVVGIENARSLPAPYNLAVCLAIIERTRLIMTGEFEFMEGGKKPAPEWVNQLQEESR